MKSIAKILFVGLLMLVAAVAINAGDMLFQDGGLNVSQDLRVSTNVLYVNSASGLVGIGTTGPQQLLHVKGDDKGLRIEDGSSSVYYDINRDDSDGLLRFFGNQGSPYSGYKFIANSGTEVMRLTATGNVGIGTTSPTRTLHVSGNANITGNLAYGSLTQNSPNLIWTEKAFVTCAKAIDGKWYVEYVDANLNTIREWVDSANTAWQHRECYEKIQTTAYYFSLNLNESSMLKPENLYFDWNDMGVHVRQPVNQTI